LVDFIVEPLEQIEWSHARPHSVDAAASLEATDSRQGNLEAVIVDGTQGCVNVFRHMPVDLADEAERQVELVFVLPARAADAAPQIEQLRSNGAGRTDRDEKAVHASDLRSGARDSRQSGFP
jgi:hypothetical protein